MARSATSHTTLTTKPKPLASRLMRRRSASACGRALSRRISSASGSCWNCSSTASSSPMQPLRSVTQSRLDQRASARRFVYCEQTIKHVFQVHGVDAAGKAALKRKLRREEVIPFFEQQERCTVVLEACGGGHHWARMLAQLGHEAKLLAPEAARPFVKKGKKNDDADAAALCAAASRPEVTFVPVKSPEQQGVLALHSVRTLLVKQQTMLANAMRGLATEFGLVVAKGVHRLDELEAQVQAEASMPATAKQAFAELYEHSQAAATRIGGLEAQIVAHARQDATARRLATIPGIGPITGSLITATVGDAIGSFKSARHFEVAGLVGTPLRCR